MDGGSPVNKSTLCVVMPSMLVIVLHWLQNQLVVKNERGRDSRFALARWCRWMYRLILSNSHHVWVICNCCIRRWLVYLGRYRFFIVSSWIKSIIIMLCLFSPEGNIGDVTVKAWRRNHSPFLFEKVGRFLIPLVLFASFATRWRLAFSWRCACSQLWQHMALLLEVSLFIYSLFDWTNIFYIGNVN